MGATVQVTRPIIIETPCEKILSPIIDAEAWVTPQHIRTPTIPTYCGDVNISRYGDNKETPILISIGGGERVSLMLHLSDADALAIRNALDMVVGCGQ
jgi:hypothetical protein